MIEDWFARRTFSLTTSTLTTSPPAKRQRAADQRCLPSKNEVATVEHVVKSVTVLYGKLVDEVIMIDRSTDSTRMMAEAADATAYNEREVLPELGPGLGKGDAMWRGLTVTSGDLVVFLYTDIRNPDLGCVGSVLGPLLVDQGIQLVSGFYDRPFERTGILHLDGADALLPRARGWLPERPETYFRRRPLTGRSSGAVRNCRPPVAPRGGPPAAVVALTVDHVPTPDIPS